ncbi:MAG TPA: 2-oxo acid dehydrogenase subunit E2 [Thermodesulfobacteriota bacterium]|nr:2-oxo acid dehydrogenase subunit E2 [Thermodesulfobacteriota bacterium]
MAIEFKLPDLGEDIETGDVVRVYVSAGDKVEKEQALMELETDKAALEIPSPASGVIKSVHVKEGETIKIGQLLVTIDDGTGDTAGGEKTGKQETPQAEKKEPATETKAKKEEPGEKVEEKRPAPKAESALQEAPVKEEPKKEASEKPAPEKKTEKPKETGAGEEKPSQIIPASPTVRRQAREMGIDITKVKGTGPGGRITEEDLKSYGKEAPSEKAEPATLKEEAAEKSTETAAAASTDKYGEIERAAMTKVRKLTAERLSESWKAPHVTQHDKADITELEKLRKHYGKEVESLGGKLTMTSILIKAVSAALKHYPQFNASVDMENGEIIYKKYYNIGIAVDTDRGLLVPVIKDADKKNIEELSVELKVLSEKARTKKITVEELQGGTFTITNLGGIGGTYFTPVINSPEVAILGVSRSSVEAVYIDGQFQPRLMLPLSLSYDHRLIDGADAVRFLRWVVEALEEPFKLSLEG